MARGARAKAAQAALVAFALFSAACGSHLSQGQILEADRLNGGGSGRNGAGQAAIGADGTANGSGDANGDSASGANGTDGNANSAALGANGSNTANAGVGAGAGGANRGSGSSGSRTQQASTAATGPGATDNGGDTDVGVKADSISLGNVSTLTGPVPGLFKGAVYGAQAVIAYQNSQGGIFGRKLKLAVGDDQLSESQNRAETLRLAPQVFGFLGSFSVFDGGMAGALKDTGIPDVGYSLGVDRQALTNNFSPQPLRPGWRTGALQYYKAKYPDVVEHVGAIYGDVPSARDAYNGEKAAMESLGYKFVYENSYEPAQTDFSADVFRMRANGVKMLIMTGDVNSMARVAQELKNQNYTLTLANYGGNAYDPAFIKLAGEDAAEGTLLDQSLVMYDGEDRGAVPEVDLFLTWLDKVHPGYKPD